MSLEKKNTKTNRAGKPSYRSVFYAGLIKYDILAILGICFLVAVTYGLMSFVIDGSQSESSGIPQVDLIGVVEAHSD